LRRLDAQGVLQPANPPGANGGKKRRTLLLVHGTFSNNDHLLEELNSTQHGQDFVARILKHYDDVFAFDHSTLSVSPVLNALDLGRLFSEFKGPVDVICHSRGGLVARWWLEGFAGAASAERRVVFVGSPLAGTSLAAPPRLRAALGLITNVGRALSLAGGAASLAVPMLSIAVGLVKVVTSVASLGEKAPLIDAAVAMIPGLVGQSRVGNSGELLRLRQKTNSPLPDYYAIRCNFETDDAGWAFWRRFRKLNLADYGADMVFEGENDLVVDTDSMTDLFDADVFPAAKLCDFGTTDRVHHTNYFQQPETIGFIIKSLEIQ
jgi:pimeloyl-ACP methyl ester carboxylesterase